MDDNEPGIPIDDNLYAALAQQAEANQRTPVEELRAILTAAIAALKASPDNPS